MPSQQKQQQPHGPGCPGCPPGGGPQPGIMISRSLEIELPDLAARSAIELYMQIDDNEPKTIWLYI